MELGIKSQNHVFGFATALIVAAPPVAREARLGNNKVAVPFCFDESTAKGNQSDIIVPGMISR